MTQLELFPQLKSAENEANEFASLANLQDAMAKRLETLTFLATVNRNENATVLHDCIEASKICATLSKNFKDLHTLLNQTKS